MENTNQKSRPSLGYFLILVTALLVITGAAAIVKNNSANAMKGQLNDVYTRSFLQLTDCVKDIDTLLSKCIVTNSPYVLNDLANEIYQKASFAQANLGELPISHVEIDNTAKFLTQVGDYTYSISKKGLRGEELSAEEKSTLENLAKYSSTLTQTLFEIQNDLFSGKLSFDISEKSSQVLANEDKKLNIGSSAERMEKEFEEYPSLIYDGPFSDHINKISAKMLGNANKITEQHAMEIAKEFLNEPKKISGRGKSESNIPTYIFSAYNSGGDDAYIEITENGGYILYMLKNRDVAETKLDITDAVRLGADCLAKNKCYSMKESYYEIRNNIATINYAYVENDVIMYSDLIKLKIALDNGEILGFEANGYIMSHAEHRPLNEVKLTVDEAREKVSKSLEIVSEGKAAIPKDNKTEVLCYEFKGKFNGKNYIVYINATTGQEEKILILLENENGTLTL